MNHELRTKFNSLTEAYPSIAKLRVTVDQHDGFVKKGVTRIMTETTYSDAVKCNNRLCRLGGVDLGNFLSELVQGRKAEGSLKKTCQGYETSAKSCMHRFEVKIHIDYKPEQAATV
jgi:hypothetical protein